MKFAVLSAHKAGAEQENGTVSDESLQIQDLHISAIIAGFS